MEVSKGADIRVPKRHVPRPHAVEAFCPPVAIYSQEFQSQFARELRALPDSSAISVALADYLSLRDVIRECRLDLDADYGRIDGVR